MRWYRVHIRRFFVEVWAGSKRKARECAYGKLLELFTLDELEHAA